MRVQYFLCQRHGAAEHPVRSFQASACPGVHSFDHVEVEYHGKVLEVTLGEEVRLRATNIHIGDFLRKGARLQ